MSLVARSEDPGTRIVGIEADHTAFVNMLTNSFVSLRFSDLGLGRVAVAEENN